MHMDTNWNSPCGDNSSLRSLTGGSGADPVVPNGQNRLGHPQTLSNDRKITSDTRRTAPENHFRSAVATVINALHLQAKRGTVAIHWKTQTDKRTVTCHHGRFCLELTAVASSSRNTASKHVQIVGIHYCDTVNMHICHSQLSERRKKSPVEEVNYFRFLTKPHRINLVDEHIGGH